MSNPMNIHRGIEIIKFLKHKTFFITGSTGFLAKVFIEKLLHEVPEVQTIYLLIRAKTADEAQQRVQSEIIDCKAFKRLKDEHGESYKDFMRSKLVAVAGNLSDPCLGMDEEQARIMADQIDVIINSAGNTKWHDRYDVLLDVNVRGVSRLVDYAMDYCKKYILFLHVSAAGVTKQSVGLVLETPVDMEERQSSISKAMDIEAEFKIVAGLASSGMSKDKMIREMSKLSFRRAKLHGYYNAYQLTKAMGEMLLNKPSEKFSTVIIRPSFIEGSFKEPFHGWIEGYRGIDPTILYYGKGHLQGILGNPTAFIDIVPVDMVVNTMIAATAYHGITDKHGLHIYHVASSLINPLICQNLFKYSCKYFTKFSLKNSIGQAIMVKEMEFYTSMDEYIMVGTDDMPSNDKLIRNIVRMAAIIGPGMSSKLQFDIKNTQTLLEKMTWKEKKNFQIDLKCIDWEDYFMNIHLPGLRKHLLKEKLMISSKL